MQTAKRTSSRWCIRLGHFRGHQRGRSIFRNLFSWNHGWNTCGSTEGLRMRTSSFKMKFTNIIWVEHLKSPIVSPHLRNRTKVRICHCHDQLMHGSEFRKILSLLSKSPLEWLSFHASRPSSKTPVPVVCLCGFAIWKDQRYAEENVPPRFRAKGIHTHCRLCPRFHIDDSL